MKVRFYGRLADMMGAELQVAAPPDCSISDLRRKLAADRPEALPVLSNRRTRAFVGGAIIHEDYVPSPSDEIEFLSPVSGG